MIDIIMQISGFNTLIRRQLNLPELKRKVSMAVLKGRFVLLSMMFLSISLLSGCEKELKWEETQQGGRLVLFSFISPDSTFSVHLSKSVSHSSVDDFERVYDGNITIYKNGSFEDDFIFPYDAAWAYRDNISTAPGDTVRIEAADGDGGRVSAKTVIPFPVDFEIVDTSTVQQAFRDNPEQDVFQCTLKINDPEPEKNYYQLVIFEQICRNSDSNICEQTKINYSKDDPVFYVRNLEGSLIGGLDFGGCFSDHLFNGKNYELTINMPAQYATVPNSPDAYRKLLFVLLSHTRAYYDYYRSRVVAEYGYDLPIIDPIRIFNNVTDGIGLVSGYSASKDSLLFKQ